MAGDPLLQGVQSFLLAGTWEASRAVARAQPELLGDDAQALLRQMAERARETGDEASAAILEDHRRLLEVSRAEGVDAAFAGLLADGDGPGGDLEAIVAELAAAPLEPAEIPRRIELCLRGLEQVSREDDPELWALLQAALGTALLMARVGDRARNIERSIAALDEASTEFCRLRMRAECARARNNLGLALQSRLEGAPDDDLERAIGAYQSALEVLTEPGDAQDRAETLNNLANAYNRRQRGRKDDNREQAIVSYREALRLLGEEDTPAWVKTRLNLGVALIERFRDDRVGNLDEAIELFSDALNRTDPTSDPAMWADLQANLGNALVRRAAARDEDEDLDRAIVSYEAALEVYGEVRASLNRALTLSNLANALLSRGEPTVETSERAIACYREALDILDPGTHPPDWAQAQNNLGRAYRERVGGDPAGNIELAIEAFERAAEVLNPRNAPVAYAQVMKNLGTAYRDRIDGDRTENLEQATHAYQQALEIRTGIYGPDHPRVASILYSIAKVQRASGDDAGAQTTLERALAIDESQGGEPGEHLAAGYRRLAATARRLDDLPAAERAIERALAIDEDLHGPDHPDVFADLRELALIREKVGRSRGAIDALERAVTIEDLSAGGADGGLREALSDLAELLRKAGDLAAAERTMERAVALDEAHFGPTHPRVAGSLVKLADLLTEARHVTRARETIERAARIERATGGRLPPRSAAALATLSRVLEGVETPPAPGVRVVESPARRPPSTPQTVRLLFPEVLRGHVAFGVDDPEEGRRRGRRDGTQLTLQLEILVEDVERLLAEPDHPARVRGTVTCAPLGGERAIREGTYDIRFDGEGGRQRTITYALDVDGGDAGDYEISGLRSIDEDERDDLLRRASSVLVRLRTADDRTAAGIVAVRHLDFLKQLDAIRVDAPTPARRIAVLDRFARASLGPLWDFHERRALEVAGRLPERQPRALG